MDGTYQVMLGNKPVGKVTVKRQGLYCHFRCRCLLTGDILCRLRVNCGSHQENLGILVPVEGGFGLDTRLPAKRLGEGTPEFTLVPKLESKTGTFVPIYPEEPFSYIARLKEGFLARREGQLGLMLK